MLEFIVPCITGREDHLNKARSILSDPTKFSKVKKDTLRLLISREESLQRTIRSLKATKQLTKREKKSIYPTGSQPGIFFGSPKNHKQGVPLRPIISTKGTFNYALAKFLVPLLKPLTTNQYTIKDSLSFASEVADFSTSGPFYMASFDVENLYTNIPVPETITITINELFKDTDRAGNIKRKYFDKLLTYAAIESYFLFDGKLYQQINGISMGSPISPALANAFLCYHETRWLEECPTEFKPLLYRRYVDDTFLVFRSPDHAPRFLDYLNSKHPNIRFTSEMEKDGKLPFLDILVENAGRSLTTSVYYKPTFTGLYQKFNSFIPDQFKRNLIQVLFYRALCVCSSSQAFRSAASVIRENLSRNGYPHRLLDSICAKLVRSHQTPKRPKIDSGKKSVFITLSCRLRATVSYSKFKSPFS